MWRSVAANGLTLIIVLLVAAAAAVAWGRNEFVKPGTSEQAVCISVAAGARISGVSRMLEERGAISNARIFRIGVEYSGRAPDLKAGSFLVPAKTSMAGILDQITTAGPSTCGPEVNFRIGVAAATVTVKELDPSSREFVELVKFTPGDGDLPEAYVKALDEPGMRFSVTLIEGVTSWQVVSELKQASFLTGEIAGVPAEGSLAPDSYGVEKGADRQTLLTRMETAQSRVLADLWAARAEGLPYATPEEALIMASIVEKETGMVDERPLVASVFVNRLAQGMRLQTDPTVIYGVTKGEGVLGRGLRQSELRRATPYNTYVINGLPPTPIANPGRASIEAALNPASSDFVFFVADGSGGHAFAKSLDEHNRNVERWRAIEAERAKAGQTAPIP